MNLKESLTKLKGKDDKKFEHYNSYLLRVEEAYPIEMECKNCGHQGMSDCDPEHSKYTYLACTGLCVCGCFLGCCLVPFAMDSFKDAYHSCHKCGRDFAYKKAFEKP